MVAAHLDDFLGIRGLGLSVATSSYELDTRRWGSTALRDAARDVGRLREVLADLAARYERVLIGLLVGEACDLLGIVAVDALRARRDEVLALVGRHLGSETSVDLTNQDVEASSDGLPRLEMLVIVAQRVSATITPSLLELRWVDPSAVHRLERMTEGIRGFIARASAPPRERGIGVRYQRGELSIYAVAHALGVDVPDAVVFVEEHGFKRSLETLPMDEGSWSVILEELVSLEQQGALRSTPESRRHEVIASQRIEGIDGRRVIAIARPVTKRQEAGAA